MSVIAAQSPFLKRASGLGSFPEQRRGGKQPENQFQHCICAKLKVPSYARHLESASRRPRKRGPLRLPQMLPVRRLKQL